MFSGLSWVVIPKAIGGLHTFGLNLLAVRCLPPETFGVFNFCTTFLVLLDGLIGSAVDLGVIREASARPPDEFTPAERAGAIVKICVCLLLLPLALAFGGSVGGRPLAATAVIAGAALMVLRSVQVYFQVRQRFREFGIGETTHLVLRCALVSALLLAGETEPVILLAAYALAPIGTLIQMGGRTLDLFANLGAGIPRLHAILGFLRDSLLATGTGTALSRADLLFLGLFAGKAEWGIYGAAQTIAMAPELAASYTASALSPAIVPKVEDGTFGRFFRRFHLAAAGVALAGAAISWIVVPPLVKAVFPERYAASIPVLEPLLAGSFASALLFPVTVSFLLFYSPRTFVKFDLIAAPLLAAAYWWVAPRGGALGVALVTAVFRVVKSAAILFAADRLAHRAPSMSAGAPSQQDRRG